MARLHDYNGPPRQGHAAKPVKAPLFDDRTDPSQALAMQKIHAIMKDPVNFEPAPFIPYLNVHQAPCMTIVSDHCKDIRFISTFLSQVINYANKACDGGYPETCYLWAGFLAKLAIHYDRMAGDVADVGMLNRLCSRAKAVKSLADSRTVEREQRNEEVPNVTMLWVDGGCDEHRTAKLQRQRLQSVNDAVRCLDFLSNAVAAQGVAPTILVPRVAA